MSAAGVWPEVWTGSWARREGQEHTHNSTILFLKDVHSPRNFDQPPEAHRKSKQCQHSLVNTKRHTMTSMTFHHIPTTTTQPTSYVGGASPPPHNQQPLTASPPVRPLLGQWRGRGKGQRSHQEKVHAYSHSCHINRVCEQWKAP